MDELHPLLVRQLRKCGITNLSEHPSLESFRECLARITTAYVTADQDRYTYDRALEVSSRELRELNEGISEQKEKLTRSLESLSDGVVYLEKNWNILFLNHEAGRLVSWDETDLLGRDVFDAFQVSHVAGTRPFNVSACKKRVRAGRIYSSDNHEFLRKDGSRFPVLMAITPVGNKGEAAGAILSFRDISDQQLTRAQLQEARVEAEAARRADDAKSEFLANMSHEMRTPINSMLGFTGIALKRIGTANREKVRGYLENIDESGQRLLALINDLLDLSKLESGIENLTLKSANLREVVASVIDEFGTLVMPSNLSIRLTDGAGIQASVEQEKIMQVIRNVLANAVRFAPNNSEIKVDIARLGDIVRVTVSDRGVGIPPKEIDAIFDKFVQSSNTKTGAGGTGLGLAICREIVQLHGGRIWAENRIGGGTRFVIELPPPSQELVATDAGQESVPRVERPGETR